MTKVHFKPTSEFIDLANKVYEEQRVKILELLPNANIEHIGSTSIPGSITKGDLDLVVSISKDEFRQAIEVLKSVYDVNQPENWSDTFASFKEEKSLDIDFGAQLVVKDSKSDDFTKLRDVLRENPFLVDELNALKLRYEGKSMDDYRKAKADFFQKLREKFL